MRYPDRDLTNVIVAGLGAITVAESYETIRDRIESARSIPFMESDVEGAHMRSPQGPLVHCLAYFAWPGLGYQDDPGAPTETAFSAEQVVGIYRVPPGALDQ